MVKFDLALTMGREILVGRRGKAKTLGPNDLADEIALASVEALGGATFDGEDGVKALRTMKLQLTDEERRSFAEAFLIFNDYLLCRAETRSTGSVEGVKQHTIEFVPRTDVTGHEDPIERLHQAWSLHQEQLERSIGLLDRPFKVLDELNASATRWADPLAHLGLGRSLDISGALGRFSDPLGLSKLNHGIADPVAGFGRRIDPLQGVLPKRLGIAEDLQSSTMIKLARLDKALGMGDIDRLGGPMAQLLKQDRERWTRLRGIDSVMPRFASALALGEGGFASVASKLTTMGLGGGLYDAIIHRPNLAFAGFVEGTATMALGGDRRLREILDTAVDRGSQHYLATSEATVRFLEHRKLEAVEEPPLRISEPIALDLLASERDELVGRARLDQDVPIDEVAASAPLGQLTALVRSVLTLIYECNEAARLRGLDDVFEPRNRALQAFADLPQLLPRDRNSFGEAIDHLYFLLYEGAGSSTLRFMVGNGGAGVFGKSDLEFQAVMILKFLRSKWLRHDPERGGSGVKATFRELEQTLASLGCPSMPRSPEDFRTAYGQLLIRLHAFLLELRSRLDAIPTVS